VTGQQRLLAISVFLSVTLVAFEITALATAMPTISRQLNGDSLFGVTSAAYTLANMVALVAAGEVADRRGPATPFIVSMMIFVGGLLVGAWAPTMVWLVVGRTLQGLGSGTVGPLAYVLIARAFTPERQPSMFALMSTGWLLPSLFAPAVSGWIVTTFGWRWVFLGIIPAAVVVAVLAVIPMRAFPATGTPTASRIPSAFRLAAGVGTVAVALQSGSWWVTLGAAAIGAALAASGGRRLFPNGLRRAEVGLPAVLAVRALATAAFMGVDSFVPLAADRIHHATPLVQGFTIIGAALLWSSGQWWRARHPYVPAIVSVRRGLILMTLGAVAVTPVLSPHWPLWAVFLGWAPAGFGMGMLFNPTTVAAMSYADEGSEGRVSSQITLADSLGFSAMGAVGGATVAAADRGVWSIRAALGTNFGLTVALAMLAFFAAARVRSRG
jgi:MFS family permease